MPTETAKENAMPTETCLVNGVEYVVLSYDGDVMTVRRPNGVKTYTAKRLPDSPLYGSGRAKFVGASALPSVLRRW